MPIAMGEGALIDYRLRIRGLPVRWRSRIAAWDPPRRFVDEQVRGPYRLWIHEHAFEPRAGGTLVRDHVRYSVLLDFLVHRPDLPLLFAGGPKVGLGLWNAPLVELLLELGLFAACFAMPGLAGVNRTLKAID